MLPSPQPVQDPVAETSKPEELQESLEQQDVDLPDRILNSSDEEPERESESKPEEQEKLTGMAAMLARRSTIQMSQADQAKIAAAQQEQAAPEEEYYDEEDSDSDWQRLLLEEN